jgi:hypothetical protein
MKKILVGLSMILAMTLNTGCQAVANFIPTQTPYPTYTPYPTFTPLPTFTPIPSPTSTPMKTVLFQADDFSSVDSCFPVGVVPEVRRFEQDGQYHIAVDQSVYFGWSICDKDVRNFILEVDATPIEGPSNKAYAYGVVFRQDLDSEGFYAFLISGDGYYSFSGIYPNDFFSLLSWASIREINQGKETNHLKVVAMGDQFDLYVNDVFVGRVREGTLGSGPFGFIVQTFDDAGVDVAFDNLVITEP